MKFFSRSRRFAISTVIVATTAVALSACSSTDTTEEPSTDTVSSTQESAAVDPVEIPGDTPAGEESQRLLDMLNAEEDATVADWEGKLHPSFTAEVPTEDVVALFNENLRPAQPFTVSNYEGGDRQAVTTLTSPVSDPMDMTVVLDAEGLITGLHFGPSAATD